MELGEKWYLVYYRLTHKREMLSRIQRSTELMAQMQWYRLEKGLLDHDFTADIRAAIMENL